MTRRRPQPVVRRGPVVRLGERPQRFVLIEPRTEAQAEERARTQLRASGQEDDAFVDELIAEFGFTRDAAKLLLVRILAFAQPGARPHANRFPPGYDEREKDTLDKLKKPLATVIRLLEDTQNSYRLFLELVSREPERAAATGQTPAAALEIDSELAGLPDLLRDIRDAIPAARQRREIWPAVRQARTPVARADAGAVLGRCDGQAVRVEPHQLGSRRCR